MLVLVVLIVVMEMFVFLWLMNMLVFMSLADVRPNADQHEDHRSAERPVEPTLPEGEGERGACKGRGGEIGSCASCAEMTKDANEKNETNAIAQKTVTRTRPIFTAPAVRPFHMAICDGSLPEILRVNKGRLPR
jgi:hypothetical protein